MKPYPIITLLLFTVFCTHAQDHSAKIKKEADSYIDAFLKNDIPVTVKYMYPKFVEIHGGKDSLIKKIESDTKLNELQGFKLKNVTIDKPGKDIKYGSTLYSVIPEHVVFQSSGATYSMQSALVALSFDDGENWTFASTTDLKWLISVLPDVAKLDVPKTTQPELIELNPTFNTQQGGAEKNPDLHYVGRRRIAIVVITHKQEYLLTDTSYVKIMQEKWMKGITLGALAPNPNDTLKYGSDAINGVNRYVIDDNKYPKAYSKLIKGMKYIGPAESN